MSLSDTQTLQAYVQELEKEVRRLVNENLKLKRQCKQVTNSSTLCLL